MTASSLYQDALASPSQRVVAPDAVSLTESVATILLELVLTAISPFL